MIKYTLMALLVFFSIQACTVKPEGKAKLKYAKLVFPKYHWTDCARLNPKIYKDYCTGETPHDWGYSKNGNGKGCYYAIERQHLCASLPEAGYSVQVVGTAPFCDADASDCPQGYLPWIPIYAGLFYGGSGGGDVSCWTGQKWICLKSLTPSYISMNGASKDAPSLAVFNNKLYVAIVANDDTNRLLLGSSSDGRSWSYQGMNGASKHAPSLTVFNNKLYVAIVANDDTNRLLLGSSSDGRSWSYQGMDGGSSKDAPSLAVFNNKLPVAIVANNSTNSLLLFPNGLPE